MSKDKETKKLDAELLEKRMAPFGTVYDRDGEPPETTSGLGGDDGSAGASPIDQPGNSDYHRDKPFWKGVE